MITFRAAAEEQLNIWSERAGADIVRRDKADPASVVYEAIQKAKNENYDIILVDTAGRLQNKFNLMEELKKIKTVIDKQAPGRIERKYSCYRRKYRSKRFAAGKSFLRSCKSYFCCPYKT